MVRRRALEVWAAWRAHHATVAAAKGEGARVFVQGTAQARARDTAPNIQSVLRVLRSHHGGFALGASLAGHGCGSSANPIPTGGGSGAPASRADLQTTVRGATANTERGQGTAPAASGRQRR